MDKLQMAHEYALKIIETHKDMFPAVKCVSNYAFDYAEAMLAEEEKRTDKTRPAVLDEFQVNWSQAPKDAVFWRKLEDGSFRWEKDELVWDRCGSGTKIKPWWTAPSFNYQGDWKSSLQERK